MPPTPTPTAAPANNLTPTLNTGQLMQNIDALKNAGKQLPEIQSYVDNYQKAGDGSYTLKGYTAPAANTPTPNTGGGLGMPSADATDLHARQGADISGAASSIGQDITGQGNAAGKSPLRRIAEGAATATGLPAQLVGEALPAPVRSTLGTIGAGGGKIIDWLADKLGGTQIAQNFVTNHPEAAKALEDAVGTAGGVANTALNVVGIAEGAKGIQTGAQNLAEGTKGTLMPSPAARAEAQIAKTTQITKDLETKAIADTTPSYTKKLIGEPKVTVTNPDGTAQTLPRVQEGGKIKGRTVTSSDDEIAAGKQLAKVPGYDTAKTSLEKYNLIGPEIIKKSQALETSLENEHILRPPKEINKIVRDAVNKASTDSLVLQKTDPIVKNYLRVTQRAIDQADGTLKGELKVRQALDNAYEDAGGKYSNEKGLDQIHRAARNALNKDMEMKAQTTEVQQALQEQTDLYRAQDILQDKARAEGGSEFERFQQQHPLTTATVKAVGRGVGLGSVVDMASHI